MARRPRASGATGRRRHSRPQQPEAGLTAEAGPPKACRSRHRELAPTAAVPSDQANTARPRRTPHRPGRTLRHLTRSRPPAIRIRRRSDPPPGVMSQHRSRSRWFGCGSGPRCRMRRLATHVAPKVHRPRCSGLRERSRALRGCHHVGGYTACNAGARPTRRSSPAGRAPPVKPRGRQRPAVGQPRASAVTSSRMPATSVPSPSLEIGPVSAPVGARSAYRTS